MLASMLVFPNCRPNFCRLIFSFFKIHFILFKRFSSCFFDCFCFFFKLFFFLIIGVCSVVSNFSNSDFEYI